MSVLVVDALTKHFGPDPVLDGVSFDVRTGQHVGLVGPNGAGKTTLLNILCGQIEADAGRIQWGAQLDVGYVKQQADIVPDRSVWEEAQQALAAQLALSIESEHLAEMIAGTPDERERRELEEQFDRIQEELARRDAYHLDHKIERVLHGLGFAEESFAQRVDQLSGGQQNRLVLAKLLLSAPDILLLDEPSNHLDIEGTTWLEEILAGSRQTVIVVSHDRYFLDRVTDHTLELFHGTIDAYRGNYSAYRRQKIERLDVQRRTYEKQQVEIAKLEDFVRRHHHGQKHVQAEDRRKKLERIQRVPLPREIELPPMGFPEPNRCGDIALRVERLSKSFEHSLFNDMTFDILRGERWGIVGSNGTGKTTLLRCILGQQTPDEGVASLGAGVVVGYFDQMLTALNTERPAVDAVRPVGKEFNEQQRRDVLARFGIRGDMVFQPLSQLSGGERNRVALARLAASDVNFLVLDEPTNHLDLWARDALESALNQFNGTILCVSHDRFFLNQVVDHLIVLHPGRHRIIQGNFEAFVRSTAAPTSLTPGHRSAVAQRDIDPKDSNNRRGNVNRRKRRFAYRKVQDIEAEIIECESQIEALQTRLAAPDVLRDGNKVKDIQQKIEALRTELPELYEHWEEANELN